MRYVSARLLPDGPTTDVFGSVPLWHYEEGAEVWCDMCREHHPDRIRIEDPPIEIGATWPLGSGDDSLYKTVEFTAEDGSWKVVDLDGGQIYFATTDTLSVAAPADAT